MLALVYLLITSLAGFAVATRVLPSAPAIVRLPAGFLLSVVFTSWTTYLVASGLSGATDASLTIGIVVSTLLGAAVLAVFGRSLRLRDAAMPRVDAAVAVFGLALSWWLMNRHMRSQDGELMVSTNTWADMGLHISLARSFSAASNYPTQYPFFAGEPIRYHFGFDFFAGMLQKGGFSVLWSFNLPGILGFTAMMLITFALTRLLFGSREPVRWSRDRGVWAGFVAVAMVMTNQSFAWRRFVEKDGGGSVLKALDPSVWWNHEKYLGAGPYDGDRIAMFNTLNAYLTQTHLIVAMALMLLLTYVVVAQLRDDELPGKRLMAGVGVTFGVAFWLNGVVWLATAVFLGMLLVIFGVAASRRAAKGAEPFRSTAVAWLKVGACFVVPALALGVPQALALNGGGTGGGLNFHLGYLVCSSVESSCYGGQMDPLSPADWWSFVQYWWLNEAVFIPLLVVAFVVGTHRDKKIIGAITFVFLWGSLFYVGQDIGGQNHKVFNLWENLCGPFVAFALVRIWAAGGRFLRGDAAASKSGPGSTDGAAADADAGQGVDADASGKAGTGPKRVAGIGTRAAAVVLAGLLVLSGLIDFMTIKNDDVVSVFGTGPQLEATDWVADRTPPRSTFLTDYDQVYTVPTMAGRAVALGFTSWAGSAGYDIEPRKQLVTAVYTAPDRATACALLKPSGLDYVVVGWGERSSTRFKLNEAPFAEMTPAAAFGEGDLRQSFYSVAQNC